MIVHPFFVVDEMRRPMPQEVAVSKWKRILGWLFKFLPGVAEAILEAKAKEAAGKKKTPSGPTDL